jgi:hypothetical protein
MDGEDSTEEAEAGRPGRTAAPWLSVTARQSGGWRVLQSTIFYGFWLKSKQRVWGFHQGVPQAAAVTERRCTTIGL